MIVLHLIAYSIQRLLFNDKENDWGRNFFVELIKKGSYSGMSGIRMERWTIHPNKTQVELELNLNRNDNPA